MSMQQLAQVGGIWFVLTVWHVFADWAFQSHREAMTKSTNWRVRFRHCALYTVLFFPLFRFVGFGPGFLASWLSPPSWPVLGAAFILLVSHFIIDTYIPVMLWAKYLRRAPQFKDVVAAGEVKLVPTAAKPWSDKVIDRVTYLSDVEAFKASFATPVGAILYITMDQFLHVAFLLPVALLMAAQ